MLRLVRSRALLRTSLSMTKGLSRTYPGRKGRGFHPLKQEFQRSALVHSCKDLVEFGAGGAAGLLGEAVGDLQFIGSEAGEY